MTSGVFRFLPVDRVLHGERAAERLPWEMDRHGLRQALIVTGSTIANETGLVWYIEQLLGMRLAASYHGVRAHVPSATVDEAVELAQYAGVDCLISLGGGSATDTAKAVAHRLAGDGGSPPAQIALPTTLSAAEFTHYYGVTDEATAVKHGAGDPRLAPRIVILDPRLTLDTPAQLWLSSGVKALDHAAEAYLSPRANPITDVLALEAVRWLFAWLPCTHTEPANLTARMNCQLAAWMSLFSAATVRGGLSHAIGHQLGGHGVPHGITSGITLPHVLAHPQGSAERLAGLLAAMHAGGGVGATAAEAVAALVARLGLPARLRETAIPHGTLPAIAAAVQAELGDAGQGVDLARLIERMW